ncbi:LysR substrate-binding domain-containing protein [Microbacterium sp. GXF6406]
MAKSGRPSRASGGASGRGARRPAASAKGAKGTRPAPKKKPAQKVVFDAPAPPPEEPRSFRLGAVPGATPGKWIDIWKRRMPHVELELVPVSAADQRNALEELDAVLVRLPLVDDTLHIIPLYDELPVVVASAESRLLSADELTYADLEGEVLITPLDDVLGPLEIPGTTAPRFAPLATTGDAIATVATGVGIIVTPMSLARAHRRKDVDYRLLEGGPTSSVALAWPRDRTTDDVDAFIGIVRGRTANSSR